ncbi:DNRLRE domain-containing protein [Candidatus Kuenenbacteria bacterium]|nr:DNRLRE domain-containing protein [Candidatus Kuenenbacteria bacterium]
MNTRRIKNIYFLAAFLLVAFFIININANTSLAADDDAVVPACIDDDCDNSQYYCVTAHSLDWTASGYPSGAGNPSCCGDDSQEYYKQHPNQSSWTGCCNTDIDPYSVGKCFADVGATCSDNNFYCDTNGRCVDDGSYFESGALRSIDGLYAADREYCFESASINTGYGIWYDQDRYSWTCQEGTWFSNSSSCKSAGPDGVCDDTGITSDGFCCGDDATASVGEYTSGCRSLGDQISANCSSDLICCPNDSCVYNNQCYPSIGKLYSVGVQPDLKTLCILAPTYAFGTAWVDCDQSGEVWSWPMGKVLVNQPNMCNTCGGSWAIGGESLVFGEYDSGTATECCGDDSGEYYITSFCPGYSGSGKCCNGAGKSIDASGNCVASCPVPNTAPTSFSLSSPANNATMVSTSPTLSWSESTDPEGTTVTYNIYYCCSPTAGCTLPSSPNYTTSGESWSLSGLTLGNYCRWNVVASDGSLQTTSSNGPFSFRVNQAPNTPVNIAPSAGATCVAARPSLSWSGSDPDTGDTVNYQVKWCTGSGCTPTLQANTSNTNYTPSSDFPRNTIVRWQITAYDALWTYVSGAITQFTTAPATPSATVTDSINSTCSAGPDTVSVNWSNGSTPLWGYSSDAVCNASDSYPNSGSSATVSSTHSDYLCFKNSDSCSLVGYSSAQGPLRVDTTAPTVSSVTASNPSSTCEQILFTINGAADTGCAGLASQPYSFDGGGSWQSGNTKLYTGVTSQTAQVRVRDSAGNVYSTTASGTAGNCSGPTISFNPTSRSYNYTDVSVVATASDSDGISSTLYCWSNSGNCTPTTPFTNGSSLTQNSTGSWTLCVKATDNTSNSNTQCSSPYEIDKIAPTITALSTNVSSVCSGGTATISWSASDTGGSGLNRTELWANPGSGWAIVSGCSSSPCTVTVSATTQYGVHAIDNAGNCINESGGHCGGVSSDSVSRSAVGPDTITALTAPGAPGNPTYSGTTQNGTNVSWTAGSGATSYGLYRCEGVGCAKPGSSWDNVTSPYTDSSLNCNTTYRYWIEARNSCGSTTSAQGTSVTTGACTAPSISFNPTSMAWSSNDASVVVTANDSSGVSYVHYCWTTSASCDPGTASSNDSPFACNGSSPCSATVVKDTTGQWNLCARARNTGGSWSAVVCSGLYKIDKNKPLVSNFQAEGVGLGGHVTITEVGEKPTFVWSTSDSESGMKRVELWRTNYNATTCNGVTMTGCSWSQIWVDTDAIDATGRDDTTALDTGDYLYGLHALDNVDNCALENNQGCSGNNGDPIRVTLAIGGLPPCTVPSQPTSLDHSGNTVNSITWTWTAPSSGDSPITYQIYNSDNQLVGTSDTVSYVQTAVSDGGATLSANTEYTVYVVAVNACGASGSSGNASAYTSANPPASCSGTAVSSTAIDWSWVSGGAQDSFYASNSAGNSNWIPGTSWSQIGLTCDTSYTTSVMARNQQGDETTAVQCSASTATCSAGGPVTAAYQWCAATTDTIIFVDASSGGVGGVTGWVWDFGDGETCLSNCNTGSYNGSNQYPVHQYTLSGGSGTKTFGENGSSDYSGVTYDGHATSYSASRDTNYGDSTLMEVGTGSSGRIRRGWFKFDFIDDLQAAGVTDSSQITGATLRLYSYDPDGAGLTLNFHALLKNWVESEATWNSYRSGSAWSTAGAGASASGVNGWVVGDYDGTRDRAYTADFSYTNVARANEWIVESGANLLNRIKFWFDNPTKNYGYLAKRNPETADENGFKLISSEHATLSWRPQLSISYSVPASTARTVILTASDSASNSDQEIKTVYLDPVTYPCSGLGCEPACYTTPGTCSTSQCDNNANGFLYQQIRDNDCPDNCHCPAWSAYQSCQASYTNCPSASPYQRVECYTGTGCNTATNACTCEAGYEPDGAGSCRLEEFTFREINALGSTQLSLHWDKQGATNSYTIFCNSLTENTTCDTGDCYYTFGGLAPGTTYTCYLRANLGTNILNSTTNPLCGRSSPPPCPLSGTTDSVVSGFTIEPTCGQLRLSWENLGADYTYNIRKSTNGYVETGDPWQSMTSAQCGGDTCVLEDQEILPQVEYYYTIKSEKDGEESGTPSQKSAKSYCYEAPDWEER